MITAKEAREFVQVSAEAQKARLEKLSTLIEEQARLGASSVIPQDHLHYDDWLKVDKKPYYPAEFTKVQTLIKTELERAGFIVEVVGKQVTVGGGLGSLDEEPRKETKYVIQIRW